MEIEIEFCLTAKVDGVEVFRKSAESLQVIEMSLMNAGDAVAEEIEQQILDAKWTN